MWSTIITAGGSALLLVLMFLYFRRLINKRLSDDHNAERLRQEVAELISDLNQTTERNLIIIEDHVQKLKNLLAESEKSISLLKKEGQKQEKSRLTYDHLKKKSVKIEPPVQKIKEESKKEETIKETGAKSSAQGNLLQDDSEAQNPKKKKSRREMADSVVELYRRGTTIEEISDRLSLPTGEVELMISLYGREDK